MKLEKAILSVLTPDLLTREWRAKIKPSDHPLRGYCYVVAEVVYHLEAKERGFTPCFLRMPEEHSTHWFLRKGSKVLDPTAAQFKTPRVYDEGRGRVAYLMLYVPVVSSTRKPLMPCHPARARELVRAGKAKRRFNKGLFYILLTERQDGFTQPVALGIDPGSKWEGFTVKAEAHTFENLNADAVTWVKDKIETRRNMRRTRRNRRGLEKQRLTTLLDRLNVV